MFFNEPTHKYFKKNKGDYNYISASGVIKKYEQPFDELYWSLWKAYEFILYRTNVDNTLPIDTFIEDVSMKPALKKNFYKFRKGYKIGDYKLFDHLRMYADENITNRVKKYILKRWDEINVDSLIKGNKVHNFKEQQTLSKKTTINPFTGNTVPVIHCNNWVTPTSKVRTVDLDNLVPGNYAELIVDHDMFCGQADLLYFEDVGLDKP